MRAFIRSSCCKKNLGKSVNTISTTSFQQPLKPFPNSPVISPREEIIAQLSEEVFSKGNVHLKNVDSLSSLPEGLQSFPEVCFIGKPNVGKSSIISSLLHNSNLGRAGGTRGTTRLLQFFNVGDALLLVDTPGYGGWGGRRLSQNLSERAKAFSILFRYLALRKQGPLKRVYWVMEATKSIQPRDEEILAFLIREEIPFSIILNKIDQFKGESVDLRNQMEIIWKFLGNDKVPILGVRSSPKIPERCFNITSLQYDITYYCTLEITNTDLLTYKNLKELSYAPPSVEEISVVERRYPVESFIVPQEDNLSLENFVLMHEEAKEKYLLNSPKAALLSSKDKIINHLVSSNNEKNKEINFNKYSSVIGTSSISLEMKELKTKKNPLESSSSSSSIIKNSNCTLEINESEKNYVPLSFIDTLKDCCEEDFLCLEDTNKITQDKCVSSEFSKKKSSSFSNKDENDLSSNKLIASKLPPSLDSETHYVEAINGVRIPKSMITVSVAELPIRQESSFERFAHLSAAGGYEKLLAAEVQGEHTFLEEGQHAKLSETETLSLERISKKSARRRQLDRILAKYISRARKPRSLYVQAEGYMCPWLAGAGQPTRVAVMGLNPPTAAAAHSSIGRGGSLMRGLKRTGFGGKSYSAQTLKQRGRATRKTGFWAA